MLINHIPNLFIIILPYNISKDYLILISYNYENIK